MKKIKLKENFMQKTLVVWLGAFLCCALWGSAFPCIKIGYKLFEIESSETMTQILFAGCRFTLYYVYMVNKDSIVPAGVGTAHIKVYPSSVTKVRSKFIKNVSV